MGDGLRLGTVIRQEVLSTHNLLDSVRFNGAEPYLSKLTTSTTTMTTGMR